MEGLPHPFMSCCHIHTCLCLPQENREAERAAHGSTLKSLQGIMEARTADLTTYMDGSPVACNPSSLSA
eukprot:1142553-Pelagomonas_calceolata.AAC.8